MSIRTPRVYSSCLLGLAVAGCAVLLLVGADAKREAQDRIWSFRNLGKAFYENPTTPNEAVVEFKKALDLAPDSVRERLNYGLALLRAGQTKQGVAELEQAQKQDPAIPHTWFNLGIVFKKEGDTDRAARQLEQMIKLVPTEPKSHYNLGVLYKLAGKKAEALAEIETAARLDPNLGGPHFQLFNQYRQAGRDADAARELQTFQDIKKRTAGAAIAEDMEWSYYAEIYETVDSLPAPVPADLKWEDRRLAGRFDPSTAGLVALDADGDGKPDLIAWSSTGVVLLRNGVTPVTSSGLEGLTGVLAIVPGDFDNDGLPDLCVLSNAGAVLYRNQKGTFARHTASLPSGRYENAIWLDYDHDGDMDLILLGEKSALARNEGPAGFSDQSARFPFVAGHATAATLFGVSLDTSAIDLVVTYNDRSAVLYRDLTNGQYAAAPLDALPRATAVVAADFDNDGYADLAAATPAGVTLARNLQGTLTPFATLAQERSPLAAADLDNRGAEDLVVGGVVFRNHGHGRFERQACTQCLPAGITALAAGDFDGDGRADLALVASDGTLHLMLNRTITQNHWLNVGLAGIKNPKLAPGATVEVKTGASYQKKIYQGLPLLFGVAGYKDVDAVRITWPNGLIQNETRQAVASSFRYKEAQRLSGSCPMIFTWDGKQFRFITDVLGVAPLGASSGDGQYFPVNHEERVQIPGAALAPVDGRYEIRIAEELREVSYLDQIKLIAVDHPARTEVFINDKFKAPPYPEFRLYGVERRVYPNTARDGEGRDVRNRLIARDRTYPDSFRRDYSGIAELHTLDLNFAGAARDGQAVLVLNGWVDWADGSTFLRAAQQGGGGLILPYLQVKDAAGNWRTVIEDMGIPAGKPKTIAVDLSGKWLSASREIRIVTNVCVYWDEIFLSESNAPAEARLTEIAAESAGLRFRGFSKPTIHPQRKQPESFDYQQWMPVSMWNPTPGRYTRYGDVQPLLEAADDRMVIMGSGDELRLLFPARALPPLQSGWTRDFLLQVDGWAKDGDSNTAFSQSVEPLPFHAMSAYPYSVAEHFPDDTEHRRYRADYNTRPALRLLRRLTP